MVQLRVSKFAIKTRYFYDGYVMNGDGNTTGYANELFIFEPKQFCRCEFATLLAKLRIITVVKLQHFKMVMVELAEKLLEHTDDKEQQYWSQNS